MDFVKKMRFAEPTAEDELNFNANTARIFARIFPVVGDLKRAYSIAADCVRVFYGTRGRIDGVVMPEDILRRLSLAEIAEYGARITGKFGVMGKEKSSVDCGEITADFFQFEEKIIEKHNESGFVTSELDSCNLVGKKPTKQPLEMPGFGEEHSPFVWEDLDYEGEATVIFDAQKVTKSDGSSLLKPFGKREKA